MPDPAEPFDVTLLDPIAAAPELERLFRLSGEVLLSRHPAWLEILHAALGHRPICLAVSKAVPSGVEPADWSSPWAAVLPLALVHGPLFGRFLVGLPYVNYGGALGDRKATARLIDRAAALADSFAVRYLELRHEEAVEHPALSARLTSKVHMRLELPGSADALWKAFSPKVRNQVRKGERLGLTVHWGGEPLLREFYAVFCRNMRDLGTPVYPRSLFARILQRFPGEAELCVVRRDGRALAGGLLLHGRGVTEVPSAASLRPFHWTNANMLLYRHLLCRAIERGQTVFDFGRSTVGGPTHRFKRQWGAREFPAVWQYYVRRGEISDMRPEGGKYRLFIAAWRRLPVFFTRLIGPWIVRGIP
ncbi:MAG: FemAB family PEP-CTERM system-associated protein [Thermogutta sp.]|nr:FemAB family PEP-CTERM system-associated protein [Thermogutta sp.]